MIQTSKTKISMDDEKKLFQNYQILCRVLEKNTSDDTLRKTRKLIDKIKTTVVENHIGLVYKQAHKNMRKLYYSNLEFDDLVQFGMIGLLKSIDGFDYNSGFRFSTYANRNIELTIYRSINETTRTIKIPEKIVQQFYDKAKETNYDIDALCDNSHFNMVVVNALFKNSASAEPLEFVQYNTTPLDVLSEQLIQEDIKKLIDTLPERDQTVACHYFGVCGKKRMSVKELGDFMGYTKKTIYILIDNMCKKLQNRKHMLDGWENYEEN